MKIKSNNLPVLETERLILRSFEENDIEDMFDYGSNPNVALRTGYQPHKELLDSKKIVYKYIFDEEIFAIQLKENKKVIGSVGCHKRPVLFKNNNDVILNREREIGYTLNEKYWGNGYVPEAVKAVIDYCFNILGIELIRGRCSEANSQSSRVFEKLGFHFDGLIQECEVWTGDGKIHGEKFFSLKKIDWKKTL